jgi:hypothetical protein
MDGQVTVEFMFLIAVLTFLLILVFSFSSSMTADTLELRRKFEAENICQIFATFISSVAASGNGTVVEYFLPSYIGGNNYTVLVNGSTVTVTVEYMTGAISCPVSTANFTSAIIVNKTGHIKNIGGVFIE